MKIDQKEYVCACSTIKPTFKNIHINFGRIILPREYKMRACLVSTSELYIFFYVRRIKMICHT